MSALGSVTILGDFWTLGNFSKHLATIDLPKSLTFLGNFGKGVKIYHFSSEIIFGATFIDIWRFFSGHTDCVPKSMNHDLRHFLNFICSI